MQVSTKIKLVAFIFVILGPIFAFIAHKEDKQMAVIQKDGVVTDGTIVGGETRKRKRSTTYTLQVRFGTSNTSPVTKSFDVTSDYFKSHVSGDQVSNPEVKVQYLASDPQESILVGGSSNSAGLFWICVAAAIAGLITLIVMFARKSAPAV